MIPPAAVLFADVAPVAPVTVERPRYGLITAGAVTLGATHLVTAGYSALSALGGAGHTSQSSKSYYAWMLLPGLGPWVALGYPSGSNATGMRLVAVASGTLQAAGIGLIVLGIVWKRTEVVTVGKLRVEPLALPMGVGLALGGAL
jgi:hypothetical protein